MVSMISTFSSSIHRMQHVLDLAKESGRKVAFLGRSMVSVSEIAHNLGLLHIPDNILLRPQDIIIDPDLPGMGFMDFQRADEAMATGRRAALAASERLAALAVPADAATRMTISVTDAGGPTRIIIRPSTISPK